MTNPMLPHFYVAKYIANLRRQEPINVGVVLLHQEGCNARFYGEDEPGSIDGRKVRDKIDDHSTFEEWVSYWRYCIEPGNDLMTPMMIWQPEVSQQLERSSRGNYLMLQGGEIVMTGVEDKDPTAILSYLYNDLVEQEEEVPEMVKIDTKRVSDAIMKGSGLMKSMWYQERPKITYPTRTGRIGTVRPTYTIVKDKQEGYTVIEPISLHASSEDVAHKSLDAAQFLFEKVEQYAERAEKREAHFVCLVDARPEKYTFSLDEILETLKSYGKVIDISKHAESIENLQAIV